MTHLDLELFTKAGTDVEAGQYRVLAALHAATQDLRHSKLYPGFTDVVELTSMLETILQLGEQFRTHSPRILKGVDLEKKSLIFDTVAADSESIEKMFALITWALPQLRTLREEGAAVYDFVNEHMKIGEVGIVPLYRDEGYVLIPEHRAQLFHVLRYEMSLFTAEDEQYRAMRTVEIDTLNEDAVLRAPEDVKLELVAVNKELPNPATFICDTDLDFSFEATILPVAKRKLMRYLVS